MHKVVITGIGVVSPLGSGKDVFWDMLCQGISGISLVESMDVGEYPCKIAGEIKDFDPDAILGKREAKKIDRFTQLGVAAAVQAWQDSGLDKEITLDKDEIGVIIGSGIGGIQTIEQSGPDLAHNQGRNPDLGFHNLWLDG